MKTFTKKTITIIIVAVLVTIGLSVLSFNLGRKMAKADAVEMSLE